MQDGTEVSRGKGNSVSANETAAGREVAVVYRPLREIVPYGHSTQKPIECMRRPIENNSQPGDAVYDPFSGSGTTIIAAEMTGRTCHAIELAPAYIDVAVMRWQAFTGQIAVLESSGATFAETAARRAVSDAARPSTELPAEGHPPPVNRVDHEVVDAA